MTRMGSLAAQASQPVSLSELERAFWREKGGCHDGKTRMAGAAHWTEGVEEGNGQEESRSYRCWGTHWEMYDYDGLAGAKRTN